jgi:predicted ATPase
MDRFVIISGCSGGGKTKLLSELERRGHAVVEEPGRRIIKEELAGTGQALPWVDLAAFAERAVAMSLRDRDRAKKMSGVVFFDRGLIDAAAALEHFTGMPTVRTFAKVRYHPRVFMVPPWPEIYVKDADRQHDLQAGIDEYARLQIAYSCLGYAIEVLPKTGIAQRADIITESLRLG